MKSKAVKHVQALIRCVPKGKRKEIRKTVEASADTLEEACYLLFPRVWNFIKECKRYEIEQVSVVNATETDYGCDFGPMVSVPLFRECAEGYKKLFWDEVIHLKALCEIKV